jgi:hypothetical protein
VQKLSEKHSHKPVLPEGALLNDAPLRARLVHVASQHGIRLIHPSVVKALNLAAEALLTRLVKSMLHAAQLKTKQAKDVPGMTKDAARNWAREVRSAAQMLAFVLFCSVILLGGESCLAGAIARNPWGVLRWYFILKCFRQSEHERRNPSQEPKSS